MIRAIVQRAVLCSTLLFSVWATADGDPPGVVAALDYFGGSVTYAPAGSDDWVYATQNRPFTTGDKLWADQGGRAELHAGSSAIRVSSQTSVEFSEVDDQILALRVSQGAVSVRIRQLYEGQSVELDTPQFALTIHTPGLYRVDVDPGADTSRIVMMDGGATLLSSNGEQNELSGSQSLLYGSEGLRDSYAGESLPYDGFDQWIAERDHVEDVSPSAQYVSRDVTGYQALDNYGTWQQDDSYGPVWVPQVTIVDWAPYRYGHWGWVAPWGWTWMDDAPWGFAPFHYGRWIWNGHNWCWVPGGRGGRPIYAPALVGFAAGGVGGTAWGVGAGIGRPSVAWFPLAPGEPYRPAYNVSTTYLVNLNHNINLRTLQANDYRNQRVNNAITAVSADNFVNGRPIGIGRVPFAPNKLTGATIVASPTLAPTTRSVLGNGAPARMPLVPLRPVVSMRPAVIAPAANDNLAKHFAQSGGNLPGAKPWQPMVTVSPVRQVLPSIPRTAPVMPRPAPSAPALATPRNWPAPQPSMSIAEPPRPSSSVPHPSEPTPSYVAPRPSYVPRPAVQQPVYVPPQAPVEVRPEPRQPAIEYREPVYAPPQRAMQPSQPMQPMQPMQPAPARPAEHATEPAKRPSNEDQSKERH